MELDANSGTETSHLKAYGAAHGEDRDGDSRIVERPVFKSMVHSTEEKRHVVVHK